MRAGSLLLSLMLPGLLAQHANALDVGASGNGPGNAAVCYYNASDSDLLLLDSPSEKEVIAYYTDQGFVTAADFEVHKEERKRKWREQDLRRTEAQRNGLPFNEVVPEMVADPQFYAARSRLVIARGEAECESTVSPTDDFYKPVRAVADAHDRARLFFVPPSWLRKVDPSPEFLRESFGNNWVSEHTVTLGFGFPVEGNSNLTARGTCPVVLEAVGPFVQSLGTCTGSNLDAAAADAISRAEDRYFAR